MAFGQTRLAVGYGDGRVYVWDLSFLSPSFGQTLDTEDGQHLLPPRDEAVRLQIPLMCVSFHQGPCKCLVYEHQEQFIISGGADGQVKIWDSHTLKKNLAKNLVRHEMREKNRFLNPKIALRNKMLHQVFLLSKFFSF